MANGASGFSSYSTHLASGAGSGRAIARVAQPHVPAAVALVTGDPRGPAPDQALVELLKLNLSDSLTIEVSFSELRMLYFSVYLRVDSLLAGGRTCRSRSSPRRRSHCLRCSRYSGRSRC